MCHHLFFVLIFTKAIPAAENRTRAEAQSSGQSEVSEVFYFFEQQYIFYTNLDYFLRNTLVMDIRSKFTNLLIL